MTVIQKMIEASHEPRPVYSVCRGDTANFTALMTSLLFPLAFIYNNVAALGIQTPCPIPSLRLRTVIPHTWKPLRVCQFCELTPQLLYRSNMGLELVSVVCNVLARFY